MRLISLALIALTFGVPVRSIDIDTQLQAWYNGYNHAYFQGELPEAGTLSPPDVIIDFHLDDPKKMGVTVFGEADGFIRMSFNPKYIKSETTLRMVLMHEMCHVQLFTEDVHTLNDHGPEWQGCMLSLAERGAFNSLW